MGSVAFDTNPTAPEVTMPRPLKVFTIWTANSMPTAAALHAVQAESHVRQGHVYIVARTKADVIRLVGEQRFMERVRSGDIHEASGYDVKALIAAGLLHDEGTVLVQHLNHGHVAKRQADGRFEYIGHTERNEEGSHSFIPATAKPTGKIAWITTPESRSRDNGYLVEAFGTLGNAQPFTIFRGGNRFGGFTFEVRYEMAEVSHETTGPFTSRKEAEDEAESILADFLDAAGLTWKDDK
jgi:hypothetical protein